MSDNDASAFESPKLLIQGAKEDVVQLGDLCRIYVENARCIPVVEHNRKTGENKVKMRVGNRPVPDRVRYLASNVLNNVRHALDQAATGAAFHLGQKSRKGYFPIAPDEVRIKEVVASKAFRYFDPELLAFLLAYKPYGGGDDLLYAFGSVTGPNKHQITVYVDADLPGFELTDFVHSISGEATLGFLGWDKKKRELHLATLGPTAVLKMPIDDNTRLPIQIALGGSPTFAGQEITALLDACIRKGEGIVLGIEAETARLLAARARPA